jgi:nucleoid DNA-binding protein
VLSDEILIDLNFYSSLENEMKEAKKILKETNETLNELRESLQSFFEIRIEKSLEKTRKLKMKQFGNYSTLLRVITLHTLTVKGV